MIVFWLISCATAFTFLPVSVGVSNSTVNMNAIYTFQGNRALTSQLANTPWQTDPINNTIVVVFPSQFTLSTPMCQSLSINNQPLTNFSCTVTGNNIRIAIGGILSAIQTASIVIGQINNPTQTVTTNPFILFIGTICKIQVHNRNDVGIDSSDASSQSSVTITPALFAFCSATFTPTTVNTTGTMILTVTPTNNVVAGGSVRVQFPTKWSTELSSNHTLPITSTMICTLNSNSLPCNGATTTVTAVVPFLSTSFTLSIAALFSPPSTSEVQSVTIGSLSLNGNLIDVCTPFITGLTSKPLTITISSISNPLIVSTSSNGLKTSFILSDTLGPTDYFVLQLDNRAAIAFTRSTSDLALGTTTVLNNTLTITQSTSLTRSANTTFQILFTNIIAPVSTRPFSATLSIFDRNRGLKMRGSSSLSATAFNFAFAVSALVRAINAVTSYTLTMPNATVPNTILITIPSQLQMTGCSVTGSSSFVSICNSSTITLSTLSALPSTVVIDAIKNAASAITVSPFTINYYSTTDILDLTSIGTSNSILLTTNPILIHSYSLSSYALLNAQTSYSFAFTPFDIIPSTALIVIDMPLSFTPSFQCQVDGIITPCTINSTSVSIILNSLTTSVNVSLIACCTNPTSTRPQQFVFRTYASSTPVNFYTETVNNYTDIPFTTLTLSRPSQRNSQVTTYTFTLAQTALWDSNSTVLIVFPPQITPTAMCSLPCTLNASTLAITLTTSANSTVFSISSVTNPISFKPSSLTVTLSNGPYLYGRSTLTVTNSIPSVLNITPIFSLRQYQTPITLTLTPLANQTYVIRNLFNWTNDPTLVNCLPLTTICQFSVGEYFISSTALSVTINNIYIAFNSSSTINISSFSNGYAVGFISFIPFIPDCTVPCRQCNGSICLSCYTNVSSYRYLFQGQCIANCSSNAYLNNSICFLCESPCLTCSNATVCLTCNLTSLFIYLYVDTCVDRCPNTTYVENGHCTPCLFPCQTCDSATVCTSCRSPFYFVQGKCSLTCPQLRFIQTTNVCEPCVGGCATCINTTVTCLSCTSTNPYLLNNLCLTSCLLPLVPDTNTCSPCIDPCATCILAKTHCTSCLPSYLSLNSSCLTLCPSLYFANNQSCTLCSTLPLHCSDCTNSTACNRCDVPFVLLHSLCLSTVPLGYLNVSGILVVCNANCKGCLNLNDYCTSCFSNKSLLTTLIDSKCVSDCPTAFLPVVTANESVCTPCAFPCALCANTLTQCLTCLVGHYFYFNLCYEQCPSGTYPLTPNCTLCIPPCLTCFNATHCLTCVGGFSLYLSFTCLTTCPKGTISVQGVCTVCSLPCATCEGSVTNCTACALSYLLHQGSCLSVCPASTVSDNTACIPCTPPCATCLQTVGNCTSCQQQTFLANSSCLSVCTLGYYGTGGLCLSCPAECTACTNPSNCTICAANKYLFALSCRDKCPVAYNVLVDRVCTACPLQCLNCTVTDTITVCYQCSTDSALFQRACYRECPSPYNLYFNSSLNILQCQPQSFFANKTLTSTLTFTTLLPMPFTIITAVLVLLSLMSKIQTARTYWVGIAYSLFGLAEVGAVVYLYFLIQPTTDSTINLSFLLIVALAIAAGVNILSLVSATPYFCSDREFNNWLNGRKRGQSTAIQPDHCLESGDVQQLDTHYCWYSSVVIFSTLTSHKLNMILFSLLFELPVFSAQLYHVHSFRILTIFGVLTLAYQAVCLYVCAQLLLTSLTSAVFLASIDAISVLCISIILLFASLHKNEQFFSVINYEPKTDLGKRNPITQEKNFKVKDNERGYQKEMNSEAQLNEDDTHSYIVNHNILNPLLRRTKRGLWIQKRTQQDQITFEQQDQKLLQEQSIMDENIKQESKLKQQLKLKISNQNKQQNIQINNLINFQSNIQQDADKIDQGVQASILEYYQASTLHQISPAKLYEQINPFSHQENVPESMAEISRVMQKEAPSDYDSILPFIHQNNVLRHKSFHISNIFDPGVQEQNCIQPQTNDAQKTVHHPIDVQDQKSIPFQHVTKVYKSRKRRENVHSFEINNQKRKMPFIQEENSIGGEQCQQSKIEKNQQNKIVQQKKQIKTFFPAIPLIQSSSQGFNMYKTNPSKLKAFRMEDITIKNNVVKNEPSNKEIINNIPEHSFEKQMKIIHGVDTVSVSKEIDRGQLLKLLSRRKSKERSPLPKEGSDETVNIHIPNKFAHIPSQDIPVEKKQSSFFPIELSKTNQLQKNKTKINNQYSNKREINRQQINKSRINRFEAHNFDINKQKIKQQQQKLVRNKKEEDSLCLKRDPQSELLLKQKVKGLRKEATQHTFLKQIKQQIEQEEDIAEVTPINRQGNYLIPSTTNVIVQNSLNLWKNQFLKQKSFVNLREERQQQPKKPIVQEMGREYHRDNLKHQ